MSYEGVKRVMFPTAAAGDDWGLPYKLLVPGMAGWDHGNDEVVLSMSPDYVSWDDYGFRQRTFPISPGSETAPFYQASSDDGSGTIALVDPNVIDILVTSNVMRQMGPGVVSVSIQYRQKDSLRRSTLLLGRLPLVGGM